MSAGKKIDPNDVPPEQLSEALKRAPAVAARASYDRAGWMTFEQLEDKHKHLDPPVVTGLFRAGEVVNLVAPSKAGKSWLAYWLALSVVAGRPWLRDEWTTRAGPVLLIDNELAPSLLRWRLRKVLDELELEPRGRVHVRAMRGELCDDHGQAVGLERACDLALAAKSQAKPILVVLDALYRFLPPGTSENDNAAMVQLYNQLDRLAAGLGAAVVVVHHSSKGDQSGRSTMDVGAGAGAIGRATDTHLVLREHVADGCYVMEGRCRSYGSPMPVVLEWDFPAWRLRPDYDPSDVATKQTHRAKATGGRVVHDLSDEELAQHVVHDQFRSRTDIVERLRATNGWSQELSRAAMDSVASRLNLLDLSAEDGEVERGPFICRKYRGGLQYRSVWTEECGTEGTGNA